MGKKSAANLLRQIAQSKNRGLSRLVYALGIRHVGQRAAALLADHFGSMEKLGRATADEIQGLAGLGEAIARSVTAFFADKENLKVLEKMAAFGLNMRAEKSRPSAAESILTGKTFVLTGTLAGMAREEAEKQIVDLGGRVSSSVSQKTFAVVVGADPGSKLEHAKKLGIQTLSEKDFRKILKK